VQKGKSEYDRTIQELLPHILGSLRVVSAFDTDVSDKLAPPLYRIYSVDGRIAQASTRFEPSPQSSVESLAELRNTEVLPPHDELAQRISGITALTNPGGDTTEGIEGFAPKRWGRRRETPRPSERPYAPAMGEAGSGSGKSVRKRPTASSSPPISTSPERSASGSSRPP
jgi:hypothetical protein